MVGRWLLMECLLREKEEDLPSAISEKKAPRTSIVRKPKSSEGNVSLRSILRGTET